MSNLSDTERVNVVAIEELENGADFGSVLRRLRAHEGPTVFTANGEPIALVVPYDPHSGLLHLPTITTLLAGHMKG